MYNEPSILCIDECYFNIGAYPDSKVFACAREPRGAVMMHRLPQHGLGYYEGHPADAAPATQRPMLRMSRAGAMRRSIMGGH